METDLKPMKVCLRAEQPLGRGKGVQSTCQFVSLALLMNERWCLSSPLGSRVLPLRCFGVMVHKVHSVVGVDAPL